MHRFKIGQGKKEYSIDIEHYKFFVGDDKRSKFQIYNIIHSIFNKISNSESAAEQTNKHSILFDEKIIDSKQWLYFEVTPFFDLENDSKMGSKSLLSKYLDSISDALDSSEIFNTLSILANSLNDEFFNEETKISFGDKELKLQVGEITRPIICKEVYPLITSEDYQCNIADFNYEEIVLLQLLIIEKIAAKIKDKNMFVYCYFPFLTTKIKESIYGIKYERCFLVIDTDEIPKDNIANICVCSKHYLDFANEEMILDIMTDLPFHIEKNDLILLCQEAILSRFQCDRKPVLFEIFPWKM